MDLFFLVLGLLMLANLLAYVWVAAGYEYKAVEHRLRLVKVGGPSARAPRSAPAQGVGVGRPGCGACWRMGRATVTACGWCSYFAPPLRGRRGTARRGTGCVQWWRMGWSEVWAHGGSAGPPHAAPGGSLNGTAAPGCLQAPTIEEAISAAAAAGALPAALAQQQQQAQQSAAVGIGGRRGARAAVLQGEQPDVYGRSLAFLPASPALPAPFR
jgi:hypothetical protein